MSSSTDREYVLNVAQQFLQGFESHFNPLTNESWFHEVCNKNGTDTNCFYRNFALKAEKFLEKFRGRKLQRIICAGIAPPSAGTTFDSKEPVKTSMKQMWPRGDDLLEGDGKTALRNLAAVVLIAAAYDLCYAKHHQNGVRPV